MKHNFFAGSLGAIALLTAVSFNTLETASAISFTPPSDNSTPSQATGGASRGSFMPPTDNSAPSQATGGASRGSFMPPSDNSAPSQASGGASRGSFTPPTDNASPQSATGGASRSSFTPPSSNSAPQSAVGGASRTNLYGDVAVSASEQIVSMIALTPSSFYGTTLSERPTILVYLPASNAQEAIFSLKDASENMVDQLVIPISGEAGTIAIQLPADAPALEIGQNYHWYVALKLDSRLSPSSPYVDAWIKRIELTADLANALKEGNTLENSSTLAENGIWYDSVALLATLRATQPDEEALNSEWQELLTSVGLMDIAIAPLNVSN
jgi:Domain of Unknown Function (DUF928)